MHSAAVRRGDVGVVNWRRGQRRSCLAGKEVINKVVFIDQGLRIEEAETAECFRSPKHKRTKLFLSKILI